MQAKLGWVTRHRAHTSTSAKDGAASVASGSTSIAIRNDFIVDLIIGPAGAILYAIRLETRRVAVPHTDRVVGVCLCHAPPLEFNRAGQLYRLYRGSFCFPHYCFQSTPCRPCFRRHSCSEDALCQAEHSNIRTHCSPASSGLGLRRRIKQFSD